MTYQLLNILYQIYLHLSNTRKVDDGVVLSASDEEELAHNINFDNYISQPEKNVNTYLSGAGGLPIPPFFAPEPP